MQRKPDNVGDEEQLPEAVATLTNLVKTKSVGQVFDQILSSGLI